MKCIFCKKNLQIKNNFNYYNKILFCNNCPNRYYDYDDNIYFETNIYNFNYYGFSKLEIYPPQTINIRKNNKLLICQIFNVNKEFIKDFFSCCNQNEINSKIETINIFN